MCNSCTYDVFSLLKIGLPFATYLLALITCKIGSICLELVVYVKHILQLGTMIIARKEKRMRNLIPFHIQSLPARSLSWQQYRIKYFTFYLYFYLLALILTRPLKQQELLRVHIWRGKINLAGKFEHLWFYFWEYTHEFGSLRMTSVLVNASKASLVMFQVAKRVAINFNFGVSLTKIAVFSAFFPCHSFPLRSLWTCKRTHTHPPTLRYGGAARAVILLLTSLLSRIDHYLSNSKLFLRVKLSGVFVPLYFTTK